MIGLKSSAPHFRSSVAPRRVAAQARSRAPVRIVAYRCESRTILWRNIGLVEDCVLPAASASACNTQGEVIKCSHVEQGNEVDEDLLLPTAHARFMIWWYGGLTKHASDLHFRLHIPPYTEISTGSSCSKKQGRSLPWITPALWWRALRLLSWPSWVQKRTITSRSLRPIHWSPQLLRSVSRFSFSLLLSKISCDFVHGLQANPGDSKLTWCIHGDVIVPILCTRIVLQRDNCGLLFRCLQDSWLRWRLL